MIPPALTPKEWEAAKTACFVRTGTLASVIAIANDELPDDDPRKITWAMYDALCDVKGSSESDVEASEIVDQLIDVLASYLPPRP